MVGHIDSLLLLHVLSLTTRCLLKKGMIVEIGEECEHAQSIKQSIHTEPMVHVAKESMTDGYDKLHHLHLCDPLFPGEIM